MIPYSFELVALRTIQPRVFGILMSLEPAAAALVGMIVLHELLTPVEWLAIACVVAASVGVTRAAGAVRRVRVCPSQESLEEGDVVPAPELPAHPTHDARRARTRAPGAAPRWPGWAGSRDRVIPATTVR